jgi:hypothetical protein
MPTRALAGRLLLEAIGAVLLGGCDQIWGLDERPLLADASAEASSPDAPADAPPRDCPVGANGYHDFRVADCWWTFDTSALGGSPAGFEGAAFDGRYLYLVPSPSGVVLRYDSEADFTSSASWKSFDVGASLGMAVSFAGAVFDGSTITFAPAKSSVFVQYTTALGFEDPTAWEGFDPTVGAGLSMAAGYGGGTFDGRFLYFVPDDSTYAQKFDSRAAFNDPQSWAAHNVVAGTSSGPGFFGAAYDGRYVYLAPGTLLPDALGILLRYDTTADFNLNASFDTFDMTTVSPKAAGFKGAAFDGRYVYFVPGGAGGDAVVLRFDSHGTLADMGAWSAFDLTKLGSGLGRFFGAAFDGQYLYVVPSGTSSSGQNGKMVRYDTTADFSSVGSWSSFDTNTVQAAAFQGCAFDGRSLYFAPQSGSIVARFQARDTATTPALPGFFGSFF